MNLPATPPFTREDPWRIFRIMAEFVDSFETLSQVGPAVTIFGSARTSPDHPYYQSAQTIAQLLARENLAVITGGGPGIMEAAIAARAKRMENPSASTSNCPSSKREINSPTSPSTFIISFRAKSVSSNTASLSSICPGDSAHLTNFLKC